MNVFNRLFLVAALSGLVMTGKVALAQETPTAPPSGVKLVEASEVQTLQAQGALILDTRKTAEYAEGSIQGALSVPYDPEKSAKDVNFDPAQDKFDLANFPDPTGQPLGGGEGYNDFAPWGVLVSTRDGLLAALASANADTTVFVDGDAVIDLTGMLEIPLNPGVTLASSRGSGGSLGALLYTTEMAAKPLFAVLGTGVRVTGLRLRGPDTNIAPADCGGHDTRAIGVEDYNTLRNWVVRIDNNELWGWPGAAVEDRNVRGLRVDHNHIHHNRRQVRKTGCKSYGLGYGVVVSLGQALIDGNIFDHNRHDIASDGSPGSEYEARYNLVLNGPLQHSFDVHGGADRKDGTDIAGTLFRVHHNTFLQDSKPAFRIRGIPQTGAYVWQNEFRHTSESDAANQVNAGGNFFLFDNRTSVNYFPAWFVSLSGNSFWAWRRFDPTPMSALRFADFDGVDGERRVDAFKAVDGIWWISRGARGPWEVLNASSVPFNQLRFGDFDGDQRDDVFRTNGSTWYVSWAGTSPWVALNTSGAALSNLAVADFDGDGHSDVFYANGSHWYVSWAGTSGWFELNTSSAKVSSLRFADFNGDGRTDVFRTDGAHWYVSWAGTSTWQWLNSSNVKLTDLAFADFNGDNLDDVFYANGAAWFVSSGGTSAWELINHSTLRKAGLGIADFNGDGRADVLSRQNP